MNRELLVRFLREYPFQPATAMWRAVEVDQVIALGLPPGRGLDLGCGDGLLTRVLLEGTGPRDLVGVDPDPAEVAQARLLGIYTAVYAAGGDHVPEQDESFDWVLANSVLEHIDDIDPVLAEVARLLRREGRFVFTVPGAGFHTCLRGPIRPGASRPDYLRRLDARLAHRRYWEPDEWRSRLEDHGLRLETITGYLNRAEVRRWESVSRLTAGLLYGLVGGRSQPIEIQRSLGMRRPGQRMPGPLAGAAAALLSAGVGSGEPRGATPAGAYLFVAVKDDQ